MCSYTQCKGKQDGLVSSLVLRSECGAAWMRRFTEVGALVSGILRIMNPDQYRMGYEVIQGLMQYDQVVHALSQWPCIFNAVTTISNRCSPMHRDIKGSFPFFDLLISTGDYSTAPLSIQPIGIQFPNGPGSVCGLSGVGFQHGVAAADGARLCHALYMRKSLQLFTCVRPSSWMTQETYRAWLGGGVAASQIHLRLDLDSI